MFARLYNLSLTDVISKKIHNSDSNKVKAFIISLSLHASLLAALVEWDTKTVIEPLAQENKRVVVSLVSSYEKTITPTKTVAKPVVKQKKAPVKALKKKPIVKTKKQIQKPVVQKTKPIQQKQTPQEKPIIAAKPLLPSEELTPKVPTPPVIDETLAQTAQEPPMKQQQESVSASTLGKIRSLIQNSLVYPAIAKRMKIEGVVIVSFVLTVDGQVESANVLTPSGSRTLDAKALKTVLALSGEYPRLNKKTDLQIPISFSLQNS
jgi:periplasmic protein TonB